jgi:hypothetical protein
MYRLWIGNVGGLGLCNARSLSQRFGLLGDTLPELLFFLAQDSPAAR